MIQSLEFSSRKADAVTINSANTATQVLRIPWAAPVHGKAVIRKIQITTANQSGVTVMFWDADLSNSTPTTRGTGTITGSYFNIGVPPPSTAQSGTLTNTVSYNADQLPAYEFEAGVAVAVTGAQATQVGLELEIY